MATPERRMEIKDEFSPRLQKIEQFNRIMRKRKCKVVRKKSESKAE